MEQDRFILCPNCNGHYSAGAGEYFAASDDIVFSCCRRNCWLIQPRYVQNRKGTLFGTLNQIVTKRVTVGMLRQREAA